MGKLTCMGCDAIEGVELRVPTFEQSGERTGLSPVPVLLCEDCTRFVAGPGYVDERPEKKQVECCGDQPRAGGCS
jgi:hypothetical protein